MSITVRSLQVLKLSTLVLVLGLPCLDVRAESSSNDWPQWRGPKGDGVSQETGWRTTALKKAWSASVGTGFSAVSVSQGRVYTMGNSNDTDIVTCLDAKTGKPVWKKSYAHPLDPKMYAGGPNATPSVKDGAVYTLSKQGHLHCYGAADGREIWKVDVAQQAGAKPPQWGFSGSPLVLGNAIIVNVGSKGVAVNKANGQIIWKSQGKAGYATPVAFKLGTVGGVAIFSSDKLVAVNPANGGVLFEYPWKTSYQVNAADPIFVGQAVYISSGYNRGGALLSLAGGTPKKVWENRNLRAHCNGPVAYEGHLYGGDGNVNGRGRFVCLDLKNGEVKWEKPGMNGQCMIADGKLIITDLKGALVIAEAAPAGYKEQARIQAVTGTCWTVPVLSNGRIYVRNAKGDLVCIDAGGK